MKHNIQVSIARYTVGMTKVVRISKYQDVDHPDFGWRHPAEPGTLMVSGDYETVLVRTRE